MPPPPPSPTLSSPEGRRTFLLSPRRSPPFLNHERGTVLPSPADEGGPRRNKWFFPRLPSSQAFTGIFPPFRLLLSGATPTLLLLPPAPPHRTEGPFSCHVRLVPFFPWHAAATPLLSFLSFLAHVLQGSSVASQQTGFLREKIVSFLSRLSLLLFSNEEVRSEEAFPLSPGPPSFPRPK